MRLGKTIRELTGGRDVDIVFEHPGRDTFGASVFVTRRGGKIVTCASTSGFLHEFDNRYLWMFTKTIIGSHLANYAEALGAPTSSCRHGTHASDHLAQLPAGAGRAGRRRRLPTTSTSARSACCAWRRTRGWAVLDHDAARRSTSMRSRGSASDAAQTRFSTAGP